MSSKAKLCNAMAAPSSSALKAMREHGEYHFFRLGLRFRLPSIQSRI